MDNQNQKPIDPIATLKTAKPAETSENRVEHLIQKSEPKASLRYSEPFPRRLKLALIATPAIAIALAAYSLNLTNIQPTLSLELSGFNDVHQFLIPNGQTSVVADCVYKSLPCNDVGYESAFELDWNYTISSNISNEAYPGQVFSLTHTGREREIAEILAKEFDLPDPIKEVKSKYSPFTQYISGTYKTKEVTVTDRENAASISFVNSSAVNWSFCQKHIIREDLNCESATYKELPTQAEAIAESIRLFSVMGIHAGENIAELKDGDYLTKFVKLAYGVATLSYPVLNGEAASLPFEIYWSEGSNEISYMAGGLYSFENKGLFNTISAKEGVGRINGYKVDPSVTDTFKFSSARFEGMSGSHQALLFEEAQKLPKGTPIVLDVTITRAVETFVTIYDANYKAWVVPGVSYYDDTGYLGSATLLDSKYIKMDATEE
jgi:hypothetical protein